MTSEKYADLQTELENEGIPIKIISKNKLRVRTDQGENIVTREDVKNFNLNLGSGVANLGQIVGDWRIIRDIADTCKYVFDEIDKLEEK